ncbi:thioesterase family protein [Pseudomonas sp. LRF_L74]|uniref:thioesterase family protein n=1 Tax=Pseudomonas sp. LRF_L74 TaxID=3369422 RepID=UPI003F633A63
MNAPTLPTYETTIKAEWVDYNDHLRDAFYLLVCSYASDALMDLIGLDEQGRAATGHTLFTLEAHIVYLAEAKRGERLAVHTHLLERDGKRLHLLYSLLHKDSGRLLAVSEQLLMNIDSQRGKSAPFAASVSQLIDATFANQHASPAHEYHGRTIAIRKPVT